METKEEPQADEGQPPSEEQGEPQSEGGMEPEAEQVGSEEEEEEEEELGAEEQHEDEPNDLGDPAVMRAVQSKPTLEVMPEWGGRGTQVLSPQCPSKDTDMDLPLVLPSTHCGLCPTEGKEWFWEGQGQAHGAVAKCVPLTVLFAPRARTQQCWTAGLALSGQNSAKRTW